jgi:transcriptional regulator with AAA-type ATPase domain
VIVRGGTLHAHQLDRLPAQRQGLVDHASDQQHVERIGGQRTGGVVV